MAIEVKRPLRARYDEIIQKLSAAARNAGPGAVELPNDLFDEMADVIEDMGEKVFGKQTQTKG